MKDAKTEEEQKNNREEQKKITEAIGKMEKDYRKDLKTYLVAFGKS